VVRHRAGLMKMFIMVFYAETAVLVVTS